MAKTDITTQTAFMTKYYRKEYEALIGRTVMDVRSMYPEEMELFMWDGDLGCVIILSDGGMVIPMRDEEGNGAGALMIQEGKKR
jgi:hypothetical protein